MFPDADLAAAASALRAAGYWNSGQECGAACRVLVHESVADEFVELWSRGRLDGRRRARRGRRRRDRTAHFEGPLRPGHRLPPAGRGRGHPRRGRRPGAGGRRLLRRPDRAGRRAGRRGVRARGDLRPGRHRGDLHRGGRGGDPRQLRALRPVGIGLDQRRPAQPRRRRTARRGHGLGQRPPRAGQRGPLGWVQGLRLRPRPVDLRARRLLPHQARDAQRGKR